MKNKTTTSKKNKIKRKISEAIVHIQSNYNNTIITITDMEGKTVLWKSSGTIGFKGTKKSTPYAAKKSAEECVTLLKPVGLKTVTIKTKGIGPGKSAAIKTFQEMGVEIKAIKDVTPRPFNGCRLKKGKR